MERVVLDGHQSRASYASGIAVLEAAAHGDTLPAKTSSGHRADTSG